MAGDTWGYEPGGGGGPDLSDEVDALDTRVTALEEAEGDTTLLWSMVDMISAAAGSVFYNLGDYTVGQPFRATRRGLSIAGARWRWDGTAGKTLRLTLWDETGSLLKSATATASAGAVQSVSWATPYEIPDAKIYQTLYLGLYQTDGAQYLSYDLLSSYVAPALPIPAGPILFLAGSYGAGNSWPSTPSSNTRALEPMLA